MVKKRKKLVIIVLVIIFMLCFPIKIFASDTETATKELIDEVISMADYEKADGYVEQYVSSRISFTELVHKIVNGDKNIASYICEYVYDIFLYEFASIKKTIVSMLSLIIVFIIFNKITAGRGGYISDISFFMIYTALMTMLLGAFSVIGEVVVNGISGIINFLSAVIPAYATTLVLTGNISNAAAFYSLMVAVLYILEWGLKVFVLPGIQIYVLIELLNNVYEDKQFSKLAAMLFRTIRLVLKMMIVFVGGIGGIQTILGSAKDRISNNVILKSISMIPGIGKVTGASGEIFVSCAVLVKNSVGIALLILLLLITVVPIAKVFIFSATYKVLAAILQPISDKRIVDGIHSIASAGELYLNLLMNAMLLFFVSIAMVCVAGY